MSSSWTCSPAVVAHGGAASSVGDSDGCRDATRLALDKLAHGGLAREAAIVAVVRLENDGRFNAGSGAILGLDGISVEMDAALMDSEGYLGAVACASRVRNPILLADAVGRTPHCMLVGAGADRLAQVLNMAEMEGTRQLARQRHAEILQALQAGGGKADEAAHTDRDVTYRSLWNYQTPWDEAVRRHGHGTVGAVVRDGQGRFAVATSTGGCTPALLGRVGDTPLIGCGFYAGEHGAIAATGIGEFILRRMLCRQVYDWVAQGEPLGEAMGRGIALLPEDVDVGLIGVTRHEADSLCNRDMAVDVST